MARFRSKIGKRGCSLKLILTEKMKLDNRNSRWLRSRKSIKDKQKIEC